VAPLLRLALLNGLGGNPLAKSQKGAGSAPLACPSGALLAQLGIPAAKGWRIAQSCRAAGSPPDVGCWPNSASRRGGIMEPWWARPGLPLIVNFRGGVSFKPLPCKRLKARNGRLFLQLLERSGGEIPQQWRAHLRGLASERATHLPVLDTVIGRRSDLLKAGPDPAAGSGLFLA